MSEAMSLWNGLLDTHAPDWEHDGADWPNREFSRFVTAGGIRFHVQIMGHGPVLAMVHGTGAATHSWRDLAPLLARHFTIVAFDLPGHGFTEAPIGPRMSLPGMAGAVAALFERLGFKPVLTVGHSAGAAILIGMCLSHQIAPAGIIALNGALVPMQGVAGQVFSPIARLFALNPLVPRVFAWRASNPAVIGRLLRDTGSTVDAAGAKFYGRLASRSSHARAALTMMAHWDLAPIDENVPHLEPRLLLVTGANDRSIPPRDAERIARRVPGARIVSIPKLGHLAHEEAPETVAAIITDFARELGVLTA